METILVVDDEPEVLGATGEMLEAAGYRVLTAPNAHMALRVAAEFEEPIQLLLTDIMMPGMSGYDLAQQLARDRPGIKILYMSGFAVATGQQEFPQAERLAPGARFIFKPFSVDRLVEKVRETLAARPPSPFSRRSDHWST